jgi:hypothetical protein
VKIGVPWSKFEKPSPPGMIRVADSCDIAPETETGFAEFEGELQPEIGEAKSANLNGNSAGVPSQAKFSGVFTNELHSSSAGNATYEGNLKYLGYSHEEVITVKP